MMRKVKSFITFDFPIQNDFISRQFASTLTNYKEQYHHWSLSATRRKIIANFWYRHVLLHHVVIITTATTFALLFTNNWHSLLPSVFLTGGISFIIITAFNYWPTYYADFLPKLDTIIAAYENEIRAAGEIKKCKRSQYSIPTLTIIFYVFSKAGNIPLPACNDSSAELLNNLYGADKDKLKQNLSRLYKFSGLSVRERAEVQKGIDNARAFFEALYYQPAQKILQQLELKLQKHN